MLFEYFIRKLIKRDGVQLLSKLDQLCRIPCGKIGGGTRRLEPDLVFEGNGGLYVFDVKYKAFDFRYGVKREDIFQLHTYIGQYGNKAAIKGCGFIYPISEKRWNDGNLGKTQGMISDVICQQGKDIPFYVLFMKIPDNTFSAFNSLMNEQCDLFISRMKFIMG